MILLLSGFAQPKAFGELVADKIHFSISQSTQLPFKLDGRNRLTLVEMERAGFQKALGMEISQ